MGTTVNVRVGGHYLHDRAAWEMVGPGVTAIPELVRTERIWFEGPLIKQPASQQREDYPQDYLASVQIAADVAVGERRWRTFNAQGVTPALPFVVGSLPETIEQETDGGLCPQHAVDLLGGLTVGGEDHHAHPPRERFRGQRAQRLVLVVNVSVEVDLGHF